MRFHNEKVTVVPICDRSGNKDCKAVTKGHISKKDLGKVLKEKLDKVEVLCSDSHKSYNVFAKDLDINHKKIYHIQNINNNMDMISRKCLASFNGLATIYLQSYPDWLLVLEKIKTSTTSTIVVAIAFESNTVSIEF